MLAEIILYVYVNIFKLEIYGNESKKVELLISIDWWRESVICINNSLAEIGGGCVCWCFWLANVKWWVEDVNIIVVGWILWKEKGSVCVYLC